MEMEEKDFIIDLRSEEREVLEEELNLTGGEGLDSVDLEDLTTRDEVLKRRDDMRKKDDSKENHHQNHQTIGVFLVDILEQKLSQNDQDDQDRRISNLQ